MKMFVLRWVYVYFVFISGNSVTTMQDCKKPEFGSIITVKEKSSYKNGLLIQTSHDNNGCDDYDIKYSWNSDHFRIGPVLSSYSGNYIMTLMNSSDIWKNISFCISVKHNAPRINMKTLMVDQGDTINLKCTFTSNCNLGACWYKVNNFHPIYCLKSQGPEKVGVAGNYTRTLIYQKKSVIPRNAEIPYKCRIKDQKPVQMKLKVQKPKKPEIKLLQDSSAYGENIEAGIKLRISGSPMPNLKCNHSMKEIIFCNKPSMKKVLYHEQSQPCKSHNGRYTLVSEDKQTANVNFKIRNVKLEKDNGTIYCSLVNSKGEVDNITLVINVLVKPETKISKNESSGTIDCIVRANPPPEIYWQQCINDRSCSYIKNIPKKEVGFGKYKSTILLNMTTSKIYKCEAKNKQGSVITTYLTRVVKRSQKIRGDNDGNLFIILGCGLFVLLVILVAVSIYSWRERRRNKTYKKFFMANNNYTIDPLKTLNEQMHNLSYDKDWELPFSFLELKDELGRGAFGKVYKAEAFGITMLNARDKSSHAKKQREKLNRDSKKMKLAKTKIYKSITVAVKTTKANPNLEDIRNLAGELKMIIHVGQHENIVNLLGACTRYPKLYMIMEYCIHGSLLEFLHSKRKIFEPTWMKEDFASEERFTIANLLMAAKQVTNGMKFLASKKCVHRDLAARNVLVNENYFMKVADFGMARNVLENNNYISTTLGYLPVKWMALESILQKMYTEESDVWSFGILLWEMMTLGNNPYPSMPVTQLIAYLSDGVRMGKPACCPDELYKTMLDCWQENPKERPSFEQLYSIIQSLLEVNVIEVSSAKFSNDHEQNLSEELSKLIS